MMVGNGLTINAVHAACAGKEGNGRMRGRGNSVPSNAALPEDPSLWMQLG